MRAFNLIPPDERGGAGIDTGKSGGGAFVVLGLIGVLAIFALVYGQARHQISSQDDKVVRLTVQAQVAQAQAARLAPYVSFAALQQQRVQAVDQLVDSRFDWAHAFHEIGRVLPQSAALSSLSGTIGSTAGASTTPSTAGSSSAAGSAAGASGSVASATPPGSIPTFTLSGCATSQTEVALTLDRLRLIDGVSEVTLQSSTKSGTSSGGSGGGGSASGGCSDNQASFAMLITFDPLPSTSGSGAQSATSAGGVG